jgi:hypothetical protein
MELDGNRRQQILPHRLRYDGGLVPGLRKYHGPFIDNLGSNKSRPRQLSYTQTATATSP